MIQAWEVCCVLLSVLFMCLIRVRGRARATVIKRGGSGPAPQLDFWCCQISA